MKHQIDFVKEKFNYTDTEARDFLLELEHKRTIDYGANIVENQEDALPEGCNIDSIDAETLYSVGEYALDRLSWNNGDIEYNAIKHVIGVREV